MLHTACSLKIPVLTETPDHSRLGGFHATDVDGEAVIIRHHSVMLQKTTWAHCMPAKAAFRRSDGEEYEKTRAGTLEMNCDSTGKIERVTIDIGIYAEENF